MTAAVELSERPFRHLPFAVVDVESTGLESAHDRILEVAIVHVELDRPPTLVLDTLVDPQRAVAWTELHGITGWDVEDAPTFDELSPTILSTLAGRILVAHNAEFDLPILGASFSRAGALLPIPPHLCTLRLAKAFCTSTPSHALHSLCDALGVEHRDQHRARGDALATAELLRRFVTAMESVGLACVADLQRFAAQQRAHFPFLRSFDTAPWQPIAPPGPPPTPRPRQGVGSTWHGHLALRRYRDEVLGAVHDLEVTEHELARVRRVRDELGLSPRQANAMHARVFHEYLGRFLDDDAIDEHEADALAWLACCLRALGWAPGDPSAST